MHFKFFSIHKKIIYIYTFKTVVFKCKKRKKEVYCEYIPTILVFELWNISEKYDTLIFFKRKILIILMYKVHGQYIIYYPC